MPDNSNYQILLNSFLLIKPVHSRIIKSFLKDLLYEHPELAEQLSGIKQSELVYRIHNLMFKAVESAATHQHDLTYFKNLGSKCRGYQISNDLLVSISSYLIKSIKTEIGKRWSQEIENMWYHALDQALHGFYTGFVSTTDEQGKKAG